MSDEYLYQIQQLQFSDLPAANAGLLAFLREHIPLAGGLVGVEIRPSEVSLNSINGVLTAGDGGRYFFKTHVEPQSVISEYYNALVMDEVGYPTIKPVFDSTEWGKQILIYDWVEYPTLFNVARDIERGRPSPFTLADIATMQGALDDDLWRVYGASLAEQNAADHAAAPIHQLFYHRLTGGRFAEFYIGQTLNLGDQRLAWEDVARRRWTINGVAYEESLGELVARAIKRLNPATDTPSIIGHGDAHNGNVFINPSESHLLYFDPAFAGRHSPFLDLTKPLFHNVWAMWMYFPQEVAAELNISLSLPNEDEISVTHDFKLNPLREMFWGSKVERVLKPLVKELAARGWLDENWRDTIKMALLCCPLLTMNLADDKKFPPEISLLGLAQVIEMGANSADKLSFVDAALNEIGA